MKNLQIEVAMLAGVACFFSCSQPNNQENNNHPPDHHYSLIALDWQGAYVGHLPCADCEEIETTIVLNYDMTYVKETQYIGKSNDKIRETGKLEPDETGNKLIFIPSGNENQAEKTVYKLGENTLTQLDGQGNKIEGEIAEKYVLHKVNVPFAEKRWDFIEVFQIKDAEIDKLERKPYVVFKAARNRIYGNSSCNRFMGAFASDSAQHLEFNSVATTLMACSYNNIESEVLNAFQQSASYRLNADTLRIFDAANNLISTLKLSSEPMD